MIGFFELILHKICFQVRNIDDIALPYVILLLFLVSVVNIVE